METEYEDFSIKVYYFNEGDHNGKFQALVSPLSIQTTFQDTVGGAIDHALLKIHKQLKEYVH
ncbi:hypothetical protein NX029_12005 [Cytobacillus firmus]|nr:hypothetical protein [Cytobacillus firmus]